MLIVLAYRGDEERTSPFLTGFLTWEARWASHARREIALAPLDDAHARRLIAGRVPRDSVDEILAHGEGSPFLLTVLAGAGADLATRGLDVVLELELAACSAGERALVRTVAVSGRPTPWRVIERVVDRDDLVTARSRLVAARLLRTLGPPERRLVEMYHDRIREAVLRRLDASRHRRLHQRLAAAWSDEESRDPQAIALHLHAADQPEAALPWAIAAGEKARSGFAFDDAAALYQLAADCAADAAPSRRSELLEQTALALRDAGRSSEAGDAFLAAAAGAEGERSLRLRMRAAERFLEAGRRVDGNAVMMPLLEEVGVRLPRSERRARLVVGRRLLPFILRGPKQPETPRKPPGHKQVRLREIYWAAGIGYATCEPLFGAVFTLKATHLALRHGDAHLSACGQAYAAALLCFLGRPFAERRGEQLLAAARVLAAEHEDAVAAAFTDVMAGMCAFAQGRWADGKRHHDRGREALDALHLSSRWEAVVARASALECAMNLGDVELVHRRAKRYALEVGERGNALLARPVEVCLAWTELIRGAPERAAALVVEIFEQWRDLRFGFPEWWGLKVRIAASLYRGEIPADPIRAFLEELDVAKRTGQFDIQVARVEGLHLRASLIHALVRADALPRKAARRRLRRLARRLGREPGDRPHVRAAAAAVRALLYDVRGDAADREIALTAARAAWEEASMPLHEAAAALRLGSLGDPAAGAEGRARLAALGVREPELWSRTIVPEPLSA